MQFNSIHSYSLARLMGWQERTSTCAIVSSAWLELCICDLDCLLCRWHQQTLSPSSLGLGMILHDNKGWQPLFAAIQHLHLTTQQLCRELRERRQSKELAVLLIALDRP